MNRRCLRRQLPFDHPVVRFDLSRVEWVLVGLVAEGEIAHAADGDAASVLLLDHHSPGRTDYATAFDEERLVKWIDADPDNMWVLCDVHHRHPLVGVHMVSGPFWGPQDLLLDRFQAGRPNS